MRLESRVSSCCTSDDLGCPTTHHPRVVANAWSVENIYQPFEYGIVIWPSQTSCCSPAVAFVLWPDGSFSSHKPLLIEPRKNRFFNAMLNRVATLPTEGYFEPDPKTKELLQAEPDLHAQLGAATAEPTYSTGRMQPFYSGWMIWDEERKEVYRLISFKNSEDKTYFVANEPAFNLPEQLPIENPSNLLHDQ
ncbi:MAG: hypothetical protein AAGD96_04855 [Chloroflexota bacterium]